MWHVYNLVAKGDLVTSKTYRKISRDTGKGSDTQSVKMVITIKVEDVEYDGEGQNMSLHTRNIRIESKDCTSRICVIRDRF